jgi:two-component system sensor histidine kinase KdpD
LAFLLIVAAAAASGGRRPAVAAAVLSFLCWNFFFLPPHFTLLVAEAQDWLMLFVFLAIGLLMGHMTGVLRLREKEAIARERYTAALYRATREAAASLDPQCGLDAMTNEIVTCARASCAIVLVRDARGVITAVARAGQASEDALDAALGTAVRILEEGRAVGLGPAPLGAEQLWPAALPHAAFDLTDNGDVYLPLLTVKAAYGILYARPSAGCRFDAEDSRLLVALATQAASLLERRSLLDEAAQAAAQQEVERLKTTLLSSLSHNLKTPLVSLTATLSSLRGGDVAWSPTAMEESLDEMAEDLQRLTEHIENLLNLAQLESGDWKPQREWVSVREVVGTSLRLLRAAEASRVRLGGLTDDPVVSVDLPQMSQALRHLLENALSYSPPVTRVDVDARVHGGLLELWVDDCGPGVPTSQRELIVRRFYRGEAARQEAVRGTGLGLSICREIVAAHGGALHVEDAPAGGARFRIVLPLAQAGAIA